MNVYYQIDAEKKILIGELTEIDSSIDEISLGSPSTPEDIEEYLNILSVGKLSPLPKGYENLCKVIGANNESSLLSVPRHKLTSHFRNTLEQLRIVFCEPDNIDYLVTYVSIRKFLYGLCRAYVDNQSLFEHIDDTDNPTVKSSLKSLQSQEGNLADPVMYSMSSTSTGRLVVNSGPRILTMPAQARECFNSRFEEGKVLQIDVISAEPKFALYVAGEKIPYDVYEYVSQHILNGDVTRNDAKLITLCALYGQSLKKLQNKLPDSVSARTVVRKTREYFKHDLLVSKLKSEYAVGKLRSAVGRPLPVESDNSHMLISHYLQSSVAESAILMFADFIDKEAGRCVPLFVIHDALIVDCDKETSKRLLGEKTVELLLGDWKFDANISLVGNSY